MPQAGRKRSTPMRKIPAGAGEGTPRAAFDPSEYDTQIDSMLLELREKRKLEREYKKQSSLSRGLPIQSRAADFYQFRAQTLQTSSSYLQLSARRDEDSNRDPKGNYPLGGQEQGGGADESSEYASEYGESGLVTARDRGAGRSRHQQNASGSNPGSLLFTSMLDRERARGAALMSQDQLKARQTVPQHSSLFLHSLPSSTTPHSHDVVQDRGMTRPSAQGSAGNQLLRRGELGGSADRSDVDGSSTVHQRTSRTPRGHVQTVPPTPKQPSREYAEFSENTNHAAYYRSNSRQQASDGRRSPTPGQNADTRPANGPRTLAEILLLSTGSLSPYASVAREEVESIGASQTALAGRNEGTAEQRSPLCPVTPSPFRTTKSLLVSGIQEWDRAARFQQIREEFMKSSKITSPHRVSRGRHGSAVGGRYKSPTGNGGRRLSSSMNGTGTTPQPRSRVQTPIHNLDPSQQAAYTAFLEEKVVAMTELAESSKIIAAQHVDESTVLKRRLREAKNENALLRRDVYWRLKVLQQCIDRCREDAGDDGRTDSSSVNVSNNNGSSMYNGGESGACMDMVVLETDGRAADDDPAEAEQLRKIPPLYMRGIFRLSAEEERLLAKVRTLHPPVRQRDAREPSSYLLRKHTPRTTSAVEAANDSTPKYQEGERGGVDVAEDQNQEKRPSSEPSIPDEKEQSPVEEEDDRREMAEEAKLRNSILKYLASTPTNDSTGDANEETVDGVHTGRDTKDRSSGNPPHDTHSARRSPTTSNNGEGKGEGMSTTTVGEAGELGTKALFPAADEERVDTQILGYNYITQSGVASIQSAISKKVPSPPSLPL